MRAYINAQGVKERLFSAAGQCERKVRFNSEDQARRAAKRIENPEVRQYECLYCRGWHNGNPPKR